MSVSIVTTCKGRLHHLKQTVPLMCNQTHANVEVIVVDYGDPDNCSDVLSVAHPNITCVRVKDNTDCFSPSRARNIGGRIAQGRNIAFVDGDIRLDDSWVTSCVDLINAGEGALILPAGKHTEITGTCMITAELYRTIRGYGEDLTDWGYQDWDLYNRAQAMDASVGYYSQCLVKAIPNTDEERFGFYADRRKMYTGTRNKKISSRRGITNPDGYGLGEVEIIKDGKSLKNITLK